MGDTGVEVKQALHPDGKTTLTFSAEDHVYRVDSTGQQLVSVTTLIEKFFPKFDTEYWANRCAKDRGTTPEALKQQWADDAERGRNEGTNLHAYAEAKFKQLPLPEPISDRCAMLFGYVNQTIDWLLKYFEFIDSEMIVFSPELGVAGTLDLLLRNRKNGQLVIADWKQNKEIKMYNPYQKALPPIDHLDDCDYNKYSLQLTLYDYIMCRELYFLDDKKSMGKTLIHLQHDGYYPIKINSMLNEVKLMLKELEHAT